MKSAAEKALERFVDMRVTEGMKMYDDIVSRLNFLEDSVGKIEVQSPNTLRHMKKDYMQKLRKCLPTEILMNQRIVTEVAVFSEKTAIDEETVRLRSHISQFRNLINSDEPVGRKLDFLVQELNREVNTIGSKAQDLYITKLVVDMKSEIEKIREQIQNIE